MLPTRNFIDLTQPEIAQQLKNLEEAADAEETIFEVWPLPLT